MQGNVILTDCKFEVLTLLRSHRRVHCTSLFVAVGSLALSAVHFVCTFT